VSRQVRGEMEIAYYGEISTPSRCGGLLQMRWMLWMLAAKRGQE
jgi:hypothetical protein